ncbi:MAG: DUF362 domain-containing protein [Bacillota bacterium]
MNTVALTRYDDDNGKSQLRQAIDLCQGFANLSPSHKVLIKPNLVTGGEKYKRMIKGVVCNTTLLANLIELLREFGCRDITIGEGSVVHKSMGINTKTAFEWSGVKDLAEKMDVPLIDFYDEPMVKIMFDDMEVEVASSILNADFVINVPTLKTHGATIITLGVKNLKGAISFESKKDFHKYGLHHLIGLLPTKIKADLTIIDGTYALEKGPISPLVHPMNVLVAGTDLLSVDIVGTTLLGQNPADIVHLREYAGVINRSLDIDSVQVVGENPAEYVKKLEWYDETESIYRALQISGVTSQQGQTLCSGCGFGIAYAIYQYFRHHRGKEFDAIELCMGDDVTCKDESKQVFLLGKCSIDANSHRQDAIKVRGCPPQVEQVLEAMEKNITIPS